MRNKNVIYKKGISLAVLMVTVIIALILISTVAISTADSIDTANLKVFAMDLREVTEATEEYYIINNIMPTINAAGSMSRDEILNITRYNGELTSQLTDNGDLDASFYTIDLAKINVKKTSYGNKVAGESDIFVIAFPSMNVYYLHGFKIKDKIYISLVEELSSLVNIPQEQLDSSTVSVVSSNGITLRKTNGWANKMGVNLQTKMASGETLYMSVSGGTNRLITTVEGENSFGFDLLTDVIANKETMKVPALTTEEANYIEQGTKPYNERYVDILKYNGTELMGKIRIDLNNFSKNLPTITQAIRSSYLRMNVVKLQFANSESGIKEVRYEYLKKFDEGGTIVDYFTGISDFDAAYMKGKGKKASLTSQLTTSINAPKDVQSIKIAIIDNAGNVNLYNQVIAPNLYIGYAVDNLQADSLQLTANVYSTTGVKNITFSKSIDGVNFTDEQSHQMDIVGNGVFTKQSDPFTNIELDKTYIKISAEDYNDIIKEYRTFKVSLDSPEIALEVGVIAPKNATVDGNTPSYRNPIIPKGFKAIDDGTTWPADWNSGLVIEDISGNQFVWVPVDGTNVPYAKWCTEGYAYDDSSVSDDTLPVGINEQEQKNKYGGFYIARYEAMFDYNVGNIRVASKKSTNKTTIIWRSERDALHTGYLWNYANYYDSKDYSEGMAVGYGYDTSMVKTHLITGTQWDTVMK